MLRWRRQRQLCWDQEGIISLSSVCGVLQVLQVFRHLLFGAAAVVLVLACLPCSGTGQSVDSVLAAVALYDAALGRLGSTTEEPADRKVAVQLAPILPAEILSVAFGSSSSLVPVPGASEVLRQWWRQQDPLPGSDINERLIEHVRRVGRAVEWYVDETDDRGYDDRGEVYVRYGAPERSSVIRFDSPRLIDDLSQPGLVISPGDFPDNEFWRYLHLGSAAYFLFVEDDGRYSIGEVGDILPQSLRFGLNSSGRGERRTVIALSALHTIFEQLSVEHPDFGSTFQIIDNYRTDRDPTGRLSTRDPTGRFRDLLNPTNPYSNSDDIVVHEMPPHEFVGYILAQAEVLDGQIAWRREKDLPVDFSDVTEAITELGVAVRSARFLDDDGSTRMEVYWTTLPGGLMFATGGESVLTMSVRQYSANYETTALTSKSFRLVDLPRVADVTLPTQTAEVVGLSENLHMGMQFDLRLNAQIDSPPVRVAVVRMDSIVVLKSDGDELEMSDLKPVLITSMVEGALRSPYPHDALWDGLPIGLYFEVYHLVFDADDQTRYSVQYRISDALGRRSPTSVAYTSTGTGRMAKEEIMLDLSSWGTTGPVVVTVSVTDEVTGHRTERSLLFSIEE